MSKLSHEIKIGLIKATVKRSGNRCSITVVRVFKNGRVWKESRTFAPEDIPLLTLALNEAHNWILQSERQKDDPNVA